WTLIHRLHNMSKLPCLCVWDFNKILRDDEKSGGLHRSKRLIKDFREALDWSKLSDLGF
ncbi:hypothetical protein Ddye_005633, partial [Dipteronia dyeriana]